MESFMKNIGGKGSGKVLFVFPHFDDCAFVSSGLIQLLKFKGYKTHVCVLYEKDDDTAVREFNKYCDRLKIGNTQIVKVLHATIERNLANVIKMEKPDVVVTFDPGGVTGNSHHTLVSLKTYEVLKSMNKLRPKLLWRVADREEEKYFGKMPDALGKPYTNVINLNLRFPQSLMKVRAIFDNRSKLKGMIHKLRIAEWYLFDHSEQYYLVNFDTDRIKVEFQKH